MTALSIAAMREGPGVEMERVPHCAGCREPLVGNCDLVAARCDCVYHRACLPAAGWSCKRCRKLGSSGKPLLDLYGVNLGTGSARLKAGAGRVVVEAEAGAEGCTVIIREEATALCKQESELCAKRRASEETQRHLDAAREMRREQRKKLADAEKKTKVRTVDLPAKTVEREQVQGRRAALEKQIMQNKQRTTVIDYRRIFKEQGSAPALSYLQKMVAGVLDPVPILTELVRLRNYHRDQMKKQIADVKRSQKQEANMRLEIRERQESIEELRKQILRKGGSATGLRIKKDGSHRDASDVQGKGALRLERSSSDAATPATCPDTAGGTALTPPTCMPPSTSAGAPSVSWTRAGSLSSASSAQTRRDTAVPQTLEEMLEESMDDLGGADDGTMTSHWLPPEPHFTPSAPSASPRRQRRAEASAVESSLNSILQEVATSIEQDTARPLRPAMLTAAASASPQRQRLREASNSGELDFGFSQELQVQTSESCTSPLHERLGVAPDVEASLNSILEEVANSDELEIGLSSTQPRRSNSRSLLGTSNSSLPSLVASRPCVDLDEVPVIVSTPCFDLDATPPETSQAETHEEEGGTRQKRQRVA